MTSAEKAATGLGPDGSTWIAEWVLMTKARKLQPTKLPQAMELADLLFQAGDRGSALAAARRSLALEPHCSATANLVQKIETVAQPPRFAAAGVYAVDYTNRVSGDRDEATLEIGTASGGALSGSLKGADGQASALLSVLVGGDRLWAVAATPFGPIEFRLIVKGSTLSGDWAAPFGRNGTLTGRKRS